MNETLKKIIEIIKSWQGRTLAIVIGAVLLTAAIGVLAFYPEVKSDSEQLSESGVADYGALVAVVGAEESSINGTSTSNNSWPGEIISLNNLQVQPDREGAISEWYVRIGEQVRAGQTLGTLSRPPQTPEAIMALSEREQMLSEARANVAALRSYTTKRIAQLQQLRADADRSNQQKIDLLRADAPEGDGALLSLIASKKKLAQGVLRGSISEAFPIITTQAIIPAPGPNFRIQLKPSFGAVDSNLRNAFPAVLSAALIDLQDKNAVPEKSGMAYFDTAIKLANASFADGEAMMPDDLEELKKMLTKDRAEFIAMLGEIQAMELERVNTQRESIDTRAEIDAMIADMEKELALMEGEVKAKEVAYNAIKNSITSGYSIVAPKSGVISNIMKKPGEFVGPGMPVATLTARSNDGILVRMSIPNNVQKPQMGELLSVMRPGFATDIQKARLVGVGSSLDENGSYMADAVFVEDTNWPVGASVRVLAPASSSAVRIRYSAVSWSEGGVPMVWVVSEDDRISKRRITIGRTLGDLIEVYEGLSNGDRYLVDSAVDVREGMSLGELVKNGTETGDAPAQSNGHENMEGME